MRQAQEFYREGKLTEAIDSLQTFLRDKPTEKRARNFLFELLCFAGEFGRARKHLAILAEDSNDTRLGVAFYMAALTAEEERQAWYENPSAPAATEAGSPAGEPLVEVPVTGTCNGKRFTGIQDLDTRLGGFLEFLTAGKYHRIAFRNLKSLEFTAPVRVRDTYWRTANAELGEALDSTQLDSILVPVLYPQTYLFDDDQTRLGRTTDFALTGSGAEIPCGQRILVVGGEQIPLLEIESIEFDDAPPPPGAGNA